jgi:hypothetical protein
MRSARTRAGLVASLALVGALALPGLVGADGFGTERPNRSPTGRTVRPDSAPDLRPPGPPRQDGVPATAGGAGGARLDPALLGAAAALAAGGAAIAQGGSESTTYIVTSAHVPELDPGLAGGAAVLLAGGALLLRPRRRPG